VAIRRFEADAVADPVATPVEREVQKSNLLARKVEIDLDVPVKPVEEVVEIPQSLQPVVPKADDVVDVPKEQARLLRVCSNLLLPVRQVDGRERA